MEILAIRAFPRLPSVSVPVHPWLPVGPRSPSSSRRPTRVLHTLDKPEPRGFISRFCPFRSGLCLNADLCGSRAPPAAGFGSRAPCYLGAERGLGAGCGENQSGGSGREGFQETCVLLLCAEQREGGVGNPRLVSLGMRRSNLRLAAWFIGVRAKKTSCGWVAGVRRGPSWPLGVHLWFCRWSSILPWLQHHLADGGGAGGQYPPHSLPWHAVGSRFEGKLADETPSHA